MPVYAKGYKPAPNLAHLRQLSARRHGQMLQGLLGQTLPAAFDAVAQGWVPPVVNQSQCGSCWCFSGTGGIDISYIKAGIFKADGSDKLSEQYTLSCGRNGGCGGDDNITVLQWAKQTGIPKTADYGPYVGHADRCTFKQSMTLYKIDDWGFLDPSGGPGGQGGVTPTDAIKAGIFTYGCAPAAIAADDAFMNLQAGQVFDRTTSQQIDHDIILVGWDDSKGSKGAWKLRNSWGGDWCEGGYCWIGYGVNLVGTEAVFCKINQTAPPIDWGAA